MVVVHDKLKSTTPPRLHQNETTKRNRGRLSRKRGSWVFHQTPLTDRWLFFDENTGDGLPTMDKSQLSSGEFCGRSLDLEDEVVIRFLGVGHKEKVD